MNPKVFSGSDNLGSSLGVERCFLVRCCVTSLYTVECCCIIGEPHISWMIPIFEKNCLPFSKCKFYLCTVSKVSIWHFGIIFWHFRNHVLIINPKIIQIRFILVLCDQAGICQIAFFVVPFLQSTVIEHLQIVLNNERNDIILQTLLKL